jgi:hypothetical protein
MTCDERDAEVKAMQETLGTPAYETLQRLNWLYGCGDLASVTLDKSTGTGTVMLRRPHCKLMPRRFRLENETVYYRGHQSRIDTPPAPPLVLAGIARK